MFEFENNRQYILWIYSNPVMYLSNLFLNLFVDVNGFTENCSMCMSTIEHVGQSNVQVFYLLIVYDKVKIQENTVEYIQIFTTCNSI